MHHAMHHARTVRAPCTQVTVIQSDMTGFTAMSAIHPPEVVLGILSDMFAKFDMLASHYGVHKVKTIGDAYVAIGGVLHRARAHYSSTLL